MNAPYLRLQSARREAGFDTASDAARFHGWNENTYRSHENGERGLRLRVVENYAKAFHVSTSWLLVGEGSQSTEMLMRVRGFVEREGVISFVNESQYPHRIVPPVSVPHYYSCFMIKGDFLYPRYSNGDVLFTSPEIKVRILDIPKEGVIWTSESSARFGFLRVDTYKDYSLEMQGVRPVTFKEIYAFAPVEVVVRHTQYHIAAPPADR